MNIMNMAAKIKVDVQMGRQSVSNAELTAFGWPSARKPKGLPGQDGQKGGAGGTGGYGDWRGYNYVHIPRHSYRQSPPDFYYNRGAIFDSLSNWLFIFFVIFFCIFPSKHFRASRIDSFTLLVIEYLEVS